MEREFEAVKQNLKTEKDYQGYTIVNTLIRAQNSKPLDQQWKTKSNYESSEIEKLLSTLEQEDVILA